MSNNVDIGGSIVIDTSSLDKALASVQKLEGILSKASEGMLKSTSAVDKALSDQTKTYTKLVAEYGKTQNYTKAEAAQVRMNNALAKATNSIGAFEAQVRKTNTSSSEQAKFIAQAAQAFDTYTRGVAQSQAQGIGFAKANTELSVSLSQLQRELAGVRAAGSQGIVDVRAIDNAKISFEKAANAVRTSALEDDKKAAALRTLESNLQQVQNAINQYGIRSIEATKAQGGLRRAIADTTIATQNANKAFRGSQLDDMAQKFRNLTTSVTVALGPLSGVASRLIALQGLFNRNAAGVAVLLASLTGFSVALGRAKSVAMEAERQFYNIDAILYTMGSNANHTAQEIFDMGTKIAGATLLSAKEARDAGAALLQYGNLTTEQFERTIVAAQGMTSILGGRLRENVKLLGRVLQDPVDGFRELENRGVRLDDTTQKLIRSLVWQGKEVEANAILLDKLSAFEEAARREADSLAGAVDAVSDNMNSLYEAVFISSGALEEAKKQTTSFADAIQELSESESAVRLGQAFAATIKLIGEVLNAGIGNLNIFVGALVFLAGSTIPTILSALWRLTTTLTGLTKMKMAAAKAATAQSTAYNTLTRSTVAATAATNGLTAALRVTPWGLVIGGISALAFSFSDMIFKSSGLNVQIQGLDRSYKDLLATLDMFKDDPQAAALAATIKGYEEKKKAVEGEIELIELRVRESQRVLKAMKDEQSSMSMFSRAYWNSNVEMNNAMRSQEREIERLQKQLSELRNQTGELSDAQQRAASDHKEYTDELEEQRRVIERTEAAQTNFLKVMDLTNPRIVALEQDLEKATGAWIQLVTAMGGAQNVDTVFLDAFLAKLADINRQRDEILNPKSRGSSRAESTSDLDRLISSYRELGREMELAALKAQGLDEAIKAKEMQNRIDDLAESVSALSQDHLRRLAAQLGVNTSGMGSHAEKVAAVTAEYAKLMDEIERFNTETDINNRITEITRAFESESEGVIRVYEERNREIAELEALRPEFAAEANRLRILNEEETYQRLREIREQDWLDNLNYWEKWSLAAEENLWNFKELATSTMTLVSSQFGSAMESMIFDASSFGDAMYKMAESILRSVVNAIGQMIGEWAMYHLVQRAMQQAAAMAAAKSTIGQAVTQHQMAALNAYASTAAIPITGPAAAPAAAASALAQTSGYVSGIISSAAKIAGFNTGGMVYGSGSDKGDKVLARLSPNEYVVQASAVKKLGTGVMNSINNGVLPNGGSNVVVNIIDQRSGDTSPIETSESVDPNGIRQIQVIVRDAVRKELAGGSLDQMMSQTYGISRKGIKR